MLYVYGGCIYAQRALNYEIQAVAIVASSEAEARVLAYERSYELWPHNTGVNDRCVLLYKLPDEMLEDVISSRVPTTKTPTVGENKENKNDR